MKLDSLKSSDAQFFLSMVLHFADGLHDLQYVNENIQSNKFVQKTMEDVDMEAIHAQLCREVQPLLDMANKIVNKSGIFAD